MIGIPKQAKKQQLQNRRQGQKRAGAADSSDSRTIPDRDKNEHLITQFGETSLSGNALHTLIKKEREERIQERRIDSLRPLESVRTPSQSETREQEGDEHHLHFLGYVPQWHNGFGTPLSMPIRPPICHGDSTEEIHKRERECVNVWAKDVEKSLNELGSDGKHDTKQSHVNEFFFERNVIVWQQLWRILDQSQLIVVVTPINAPLLHLPVPIIESAKEIPVICVLTKKDLVTKQLSETWIEEIRRRFPAFDSIVAVSADAKGCKSSSKRWQGQTDDGFSELLKALSSVVVKKDGWAGTIEDILISSAQADESVYSPDQAFLTDQPSVDSPSLYENVNLLATETETVRTEHSGHAVQSSSSSLGLWTRASQWRTDRKLGTRMCAPASRNHVSIGIIGEPNTGKSALVDRLLGKSVAGVSNTPGKTKRLQTHFIASELVLLDCPGLIFPKRISRALGVLCGNLAVAQCKEPYSAVRLLCDLYSAEVVAKSFDIILPVDQCKSFSPFELMELFAEKVMHKCFCTLCAPIVCMIQGNMIVRCTY